MSYLEMPALPAMSKAIISFWFRDASRGQAPPENKWPDGFWTEATANETMVPPNCQALVQIAKQNGQFPVYWWNSYGLPLGGVGQLIFGDLILGPIAVWIPCPPPLSINGIRTFLTFGDPNQLLNYCTWREETPGVIKTVDVISRLETLVVPGIGFQLADYPPPYPPYFLKEGADGFFTPKILRLNPATPKLNMVPQSYIGIDRNGYLTICLQTNTKADYKGMAFEQTNMTELWTSATELIVPDGHLDEAFWVQVPGYWHGYQFEYNDVSTEVMGSSPESFYLGGSPTSALDFARPLIRDGGWHHVLFSFDIGGSVSSIFPETPPLGGDSDATTPPTVSTSCRAWLALDDKEYTGSGLQENRAVNDGLIGLPKLNGTQTTQIIDFGPMEGMLRSSLGLGPNDIVPQNVFIHPFSRRNAKDGLLQFVSNLGLSTGNPDVPAGDFNVLAMTGRLWPLWGHGKKPGPWLAVATPPRPTVPDPKSFDVASYRCSGFNIPEGPLGIPASARHIDHNTGVEMAELQIWIGQSTTVDLSVRRLFIDDKGKPVTPKKAADVLGKPDVLLHGTNNWKNGRNTGTLGVDANGETKPSGQFVPVARIEKYLPDPKLGK